MKKTMAILFGISVFAGAGYVAFAYTPVGKIALSKWLIKKWEKLAKREKKTIDTLFLAKELKKLSYNDHELLVRFTLFDPVRKEREGKTKITQASLVKLRKRYKKLKDKLVDSKMNEKADLISLFGIVLPAAG